MSFAYFTKTINKILEHHIPLPPFLKLYSTKRKPFTSDVAAIAVIFQCYYFNLEPSLFGGRWEWRVRLSPAGQMCLHVASAAHNGTHSR